MSGSIHQRSLRSTRSPIRRTPDAVAIDLTLGRGSLGGKDIEGTSAIAVGYGWMELQQLRYFVAVAGTGKFTAAARDLHVAQPSISKQVRKLEDELGAVLLERRRTGVALTDAGAILLPWAKRMLADLDGARSEVAGLATLERGRLSVGATPSLSTVLLPRVLAAFHAEHPGITLSVVEAGSRDLVERLGSGDLDLALVILPVPHEELFD